MTTAPLLLLLAVAPIEPELPTLEALYQDLHQHPELSFKEVKTAAKLAQRLKALGFEVTTQVGKTGVVGVLKNGAGPTVLVRTEMDALPVEEKTGVPYASRETAVDANGRTVSVMHACAHDMHMASWVGAATLLAKSKGNWHGTLVMIAQPAEEEGNGAKAMLAAGLYARFGRPDFAVALHAKADLPAGTIGYVKGPAMANVDSVDVTLYGRGGHGASPHTAIDPIVLAARYVLSLQTLVAREVNPIEPAVVTVGSIHGGTRHNIIPDEVKLQLTLRSYSDAVRRQLLDGVARLAKAESVAARSPKEPLIEVDAGPGAVINDPALTERLVRAVAGTLGTEHLVEVDKVMGAEDFGEYARAGGYPSTMLWLGGVEPKRYEAARSTGAPLPAAHSSTWAPEPNATLRTGALTLTTAVLELMGR